MIKLEAQIYLMIKKSTLLTSLLLLIFTFSCKEDEEDYIPIKIETNLDVVETLQDTAVEIDIFLNDLNIPDNGSLEVSSATNGIVEITISDNFIDSSVTYIPNNEFYGQDTFQYTVCLDSNCSTGTVNIDVLPITPVNFNLEAFPYDVLSEYNFFKGTISNLDPVFGVLPYDLNSKLFSDYAKKKRFVWMPDDVKANYVSDGQSLDFPEGSILIKNFYYDNVLPSGNTKIIETRLMIKKEGEWTFANYLWNDDQTEAFFTTSGSLVSFEWIDDLGETKAVNYQVPPFSQCFACHNNGNGLPLPIGPKPQNLNKDYEYVDGISNQLNKWVNFDYLTNNLPSNIVSTINWKDESKSLELRARSYLDINCAHCHSDEGFCSYRALRFSFQDTSDPENMGVCVDAEQETEDGSTVIINAGSAESSVLFYRINTLQEEYKMPLLGRNLRHIEGIQLIEDWINSLETNCE